MSPFGSILMESNRSSTPPNGSGHCRRQATGRSVCGCTTVSGPAGGWGVGVADGGGSDGAVVGVVGGALDGVLVGFLDGVADGSGVGALDGVLVGFLDGVADGSGVGVSVGTLRDVAGVGSQR